MTTYYPDIDLTADESGRIINPGKFEREPIYVPYLWERVVLESMADETIDDNGTDIEIVIITADERRKFHVPTGIYAVALWERSDGFVCSTTLDTQDELTDYRAQCLGVEVCDVCRANGPYAGCDCNQDSDEPTEPAEDDITTTDHERFYESGKLVLERSGDDWYGQVGSSNVNLGAFGDDYRAALSAYMDRSGYFPNCWFISDHGNAHLIEWPQP